MITVCASDKFGALSILDAIFFFELLADRDGDMFCSGYECFMTCISNIGHHIYISLNDDEDRYGHSPRLKSLR